MTSQVHELEDINADIEDIPTACDLATNEGWKDAGANAENLGRGKSGTYTYGPKLQ